MLVLSRKVGERIVIDESIVVEVLQTRGGRVKLGIRCPREIPVHREEVHREVSPARPTWADPPAPSRAG